MRILFLPLLLPWLLAQAAPEPASQVDDEALLRKLDVLAQVLSQIDTNYVDAVTPIDLVYAAAQGALARLDAHSSFLTPDAYRALLDATEGEYAGVGVDFDVRDAWPRVIAVLPKSPAERAGVRGGDTLVRIDAEDLHDVDYDKVWRLLHGAVGSTTRLGIRRDVKGAPAPQQLELSVQRAWVRVEPLVFRQFGDVTYVQLTTFSRHVSQSLQAFLQDTHVRRGLVLDLRGNPGGLFDEAVQVADLFLSQGTIVRTVGRGGKIIDAPQARAEATQPDYPLALLVDGDSASAAEILAGALQDHRRARLFGATTFGKGSVQSIVDLLDGSGLKMTVARYMTPNGTRIEGRGIVPDEPLPRTAGKHDTDIAAAINYLRSPQAS